MKSRTFLYILVALAIVAVAAFVIYQLVYRGAGNNGAGTGQTGSLPGSASQQFPPSGGTTITNFNAGATNASSSRFGIVSQDPSLDYFVDPANIVWLIKPDGTIESVQNNKSRIVSTTTFPDIISATFSYDGKKVLVASRNGTTTQSSVFDLAKNSWVRLPDGMQSSVWSPSNYQIAYLVPLNSGTETLSMIDVGTADPKPNAVSSLAMENSILQWPAKNTIIVSDRPSAYTTGSIWLFNVSSQTISSVAYEELGAESAWNASGSALIFSATSDNAGGQLMLLGNAGTPKTLSFATLPSKCAFGTPMSASGTVNLFYCAVPHDQDMFAMARLPDEYDQKIFFTDDDFYRVDAGADTLTQIFSYSAANIDLDATRIKIFNNILFFINRYDQKVYALSL